MGQALKKMKNPERGFHFLAWPTEAAAPVSEGGRFGRMGNRGCPRPGVGGRWWPHSGEAGFFLGYN